MGSFSLSSNELLIDYIEEQMFVKARLDDVKKSLINGDIERFRALNELPKKDRVRIVNLAIKSARKKVEKELFLSPEIITAKLLGIADTSDNAETILKAYDRICKVMGYDKPEKKEITIKDISIDVE